MGQVALFPSQKSARCSDELAAEQKSWFSHLVLEDFLIPQVLTTDPTTTLHRALGLQICVAKERAAHNDRWTQLTSFIRQDECELRRPVTLRVEIFDHIFGQWSGCAKGSRKTDYHRRHRAKSRLRPRSIGKECVSPRPRSLPLEFDQFLNAPERRRRRHFSRGRGAHGARSQPQEAPDAQGLARASLPGATPLQVIALRVIGSRGRPEPRADVKPSERCDDARRPSCFTPDEARRIAADARAAGGPDYAR